MSVSSSPERIEGNEFGVRDARSSAQATSTSTAPGSAACTAERVDGCRDACTKNDQEACALVAWHLEQTSGDGNDEVLRLYETACNHSVGFACVSAGNIHVNTGHLNAAIQRYRSACKVGTHVGCANLAYYYATGTVVKKDIATAERLFRQACRGNDPEGCGELAILYIKEPKLAGTGKVAQLLASACEAGAIGRCHTLGFLYADGKVVAQDSNRAADWFRKGCEGGYANACDHLGYLVGTGALGEADHAYAGQLFRKACDGGIAEGCFHLAESYSKGLGVALDEERAKELIIKGCEIANAAGKREPECTKREP
jgi:hypothetical protein